MPALILIWLNRTGTWIRMLYAIRSLLLPALPPNFKPLRGSLYKRPPFGYNTGELCVLLPFFFRVKALPA
jgi:hypothetical protein